MKYSYSFRSGTSYSRGVTADDLLTKEDCAALYAKWDKSWGEPLSFQGGETAITCDMIHQVPLNALNKVYGKKLAARLLDATAEFKEV